jgi:hypothetical protein
LLPFIPAYSPGGEDVKSLTHFSPKSRDLKPPNWVLTCGNPAATMSLAAGKPRFPAGRDVDAISDSFRWSGHAATKARPSSVILAGGCQLTSVLAPEASPSFQLLGGQVMRTEAWLLLRL